MLILVFALLCICAQSAPVESEGSYVPLEFVQLTADQIRSANLAAQNDSADLARAYRSTISLVVKEIKLGGKAYKVSLETYPRWLVVFDKDFAGKGQLSAGTPLYSPSSTARDVGQNFEVVSGADKFVGKVYEDDLDYLGYTHRQYIGSAKSWSGFGGKQFPLHGILGFGWDKTKPLNYTPSASPVINAMAKGKLLAYQIRLSKTAPTLVLGLTNGCLKMPMFYHMIDKLDQALIPLDGLVFGKTQIVPRDSHVYFETGYGQIILPPAIWNQIQRQVDSKWDRDLGLYTVDCAQKLPNMTFHFVRRDYPVQSKHYILDVGLGNGKCAFAAEPLQISPDREVYVLGVPFFRAYCVSFDLSFHKIGIALNPDEKTFLKKPAELKPSGN